MKTGDERKKEELMCAYGLTDKDMTISVDELDRDKTVWRFKIEFGGSFMYSQVGDYGYFDGENFRLKPQYVKQEDITNIMKESLRLKRNLFIEQWKDIYHFKDGVIY